MCDMSAERNAPHFTLMMRNNWSYDILKNERQEFDKPEFDDLVNCYFST